MSSLAQRNLPKSLRDEIQRYLDAHNKFQRKPKMTDRAKYFAPTHVSGYLDIESRSQSRSLRST